MSSQTMSFQKTHQPPPSPPPSPPRNTRISTTCCSCSYTTVSIFYTSPSPPLKEFSNIDPALFALDPHSTSPAEIIKETNHSGANACRNTNCRHTFCGVCIVVKHRKLWWCNRCGKGNIGEEEERKCGKCGVWKRRDECEMWWKGGLGIFENGGRMAREHQEVQEKEEDMGLRVGEGSVDNCGADMGDYGYASPNGVIYSGEYPEIIIQSGYYDGKIVGERYWL